MTRDEAATAEQCVALIDYTAQFADEISFARGDILHVTHKGGHSGYWQGYVVYPASMSATVEAAMALAKAGDEVGAAHTLTRTQRTDQRGVATALWPAQADERSGAESGEDKDDDDGDNDTTETASFPTGRSDRLDRRSSAQTPLAYAGATSPPVPHSGKDGDRKPHKTGQSTSASEKKSSSSRRGRRGVIASLFSSLKSSKTHRQREHGTESATTDPETRSSTASSPPPAPTSTIHVVSPPSANPAHTAETRRRPSAAVRASVGREGLFPSCAISSNVAPDLALMRAFQQKCLALFPYTARDASEMSFEVEDVLTAVRPGPSPGWWYGYNVSALEPVRRQARRQVSRRASHARRHAHNATATNTAFLSDITLPWEAKDKEKSASKAKDGKATATAAAAVEEEEENEAGDSGNQTPNRSSRTNPPLHLSPFLFSRCSARFDEVAMAAATDDHDAMEDEDTGRERDMAEGHHPLGARDASEHSFVSATTSTSNVSFGSTLLEPHHWSFLSSLDPVTRTKVEAHCGTLRRPLLFPTNYVTSDIVLTVFRFDARQPHELSIDVGDVLRVHRRWNDGWWEGSLRGKRGIFPSNYTVPNVPALPDIPHMARLGSTASSTIVDDERDTGGSVGGGDGDRTAALASAMAAMTFPPDPRTPLSPYGTATATPLMAAHAADWGATTTTTVRAPVFFCALCKSTLAAESRAEVGQSALTCRTCQQHEAITEAMLRALERYTYGSMDGDSETERGRVSSSSAKLDLFETVPLFPSDATSTGTPSLLTNKDVADVSFSRIKFV